MTVPTPRDVAAGRVRPTFSADNTEELGALADELLGLIRFTPVDQPGGRTDQAAADAPEADDGRRASGRDRASVRSYLEQADATLDHARECDGLGSKESARNARLDAAVLVGCALARGVEQTSSGLHRLAHAVDRIATPAAPR